MQVYFCPLFICLLKYIISLKYDYFIVVAIIHKLHHVGFYMESFRFSEEEPLGFWPKNPMKWFCIELLEVPYMKQVIYQNPFFPKSVS